jgi:hypothetical protein
VKSGNTAARKYILYLPPLCASSCIWNKITRNISKPLNAKAPDSLYMRTRASGSIPVDLT